MDKVRYGIIGLGNIGSHHFSYLINNEIDGAILAAIADIKKEKIEAISNKYNLKGIEIYASGDELIEKGNVDAIIIAVPHYSHPSLAIKALNKGINVICEKPAGVYTKQVKELNECAKKSNALFTMMFNQRTNSIYKKMREIIQNGEIGTIKRVVWQITDWYRSQAYYDSGDWRATWAGEGGGVLLNQCPHQLDLLIWTTGMIPSKVKAFCHFGKWHNIEVEDDVTAYLEYENGATGVFITSTADSPGVNRFEVLGTKGRIETDSKELILYKNEIDEREHCINTKNGFEAVKFNKEIIPTDGSNPQHKGITQNFTNAIRGIEPLYVSGVEGLNSVELMNSMLLSTWLDKTVSIPIDDDLYFDELNKRIKTSKLKVANDIIFDNCLDNYK